MKTTRINSNRETVEGELVFENCLNTDPGGNPCLGFKHSNRDFFRQGWPSFLGMFNPEGECPERIVEATPEEARQFCNWWKRREKVWKDYGLDDPLFEPYHKRPDPKDWLPPGQVVARAPKEKPIWMKEEKKVRWGDWIAWVVIPIVVFLVISLSLILAD